jgi:hypothetical protein
VTGPVLFDPFDNGAPRLAALLAACAEGRAPEVRAEIERHLAQHPADSEAAVLLRLIAAAAPDFGAARRLVAAEAERARAAADEEIARLLAKQEQQAALLDKLAYVNEELERQQRELLASRWRRLGRRLGLAKRASFET